MNPTDFTADDLVHSLNQLADIAVQLDDHGALYGLIGPNAALGRPAKLALIAALRAKDQGATVQRLIERHAVVLPNDPDHREIDREARRQQWADEAAEDAWHDRQGCD